MRFKPAVWQPISILLSGANLVFVGAAAQAGEGIHAGIHAVLALAFGLWAQRLRSTPQAASGDLQAGLESLEFEVSRLRQELSETQERVDFAERVLGQAQEARRMGPS
jgi:hypothetical protein